MFVVSILFFNYMKGKFKMNYKDIKMNFIINKIILSDVTKIVPSNKKSKIRDINIDLFIKST